MAEYIQNVGVEMLSKYAWTMLPTCIVHQTSWRCVVPNLILSRLCGTLFSPPFGGLGEGTMGETSCDPCKDNCFFHLDTPHASCNLLSIWSNPQLVTPCKNIICHKFSHGWQIGYCIEAIEKTIIDPNWLVFVNSLWTFHQRGSISKAIEVRWNVQSDVFRTFVQILFTWLSQSW